MWAIKVGRLQSVLLTKCVHLLQKIFYIVRVIIKLRAPDLCRVRKCVLLLVQLVPEELRDCESSIVAGWQHQSVEQVFQSDHITTFKIG